MATDRLIFLGPLPPPVHGMANVNAHIVELLKEVMSVSTVSVTADMRRGPIVYHALKASRALHGVAKLVRERLRGTRVLYTSADDRLGGIWTAIFLIVARGLGYRIFLHHHSYIYIVERKRLMAAITRVAGPAAWHVVLCDEMEAAMAALYPAARHFIVCPNTVTTPAKAVVPDRPRIGLTIGLLSNLMFEKGLTEFVELVEWAGEQGMDVRGVLAGPAFRAEEGAYIATKLEALGERLKWLGFVDGARKDAFFDDIDLFVFPTKYRTESFGLVLLEALVRGVPIISPERGCICVFKNEEAATIVPLTTAFQDAAREQIRRFANSPDTVARLSQSALAAGERLNGAHALAQRSLVTQIVAAAG